MTPWQKVHSKFGISAAGLAKLIGRDRSKVSRAVRDPEGKISSSDIDRLMAAAAAKNITLTLDDFRSDDAKRA